MRRALGDERGSHTIEMALLLPAIFLVMFAGVQTALYYYARSIAIGAAQEGARAAAAYEATAGDGIGEATSFIVDVGWDDALTSAVVSGSRSATSSTVVVTGQALSVIPGWAPTITQSASMPNEVLTGAP